MWTITPLFLIENVQRWREGYNRGVEDGLARFVLRLLLLVAFLIFVESPKILRLSTDRRSALEESNLQRNVQKLPVKPYHLWIYFFSSFSKLSSFRRLESVDAYYSYWGF